MPGKILSPVRFAKPSPFELYLPAVLPAPLLCVTPLLGRLVLFEDLLLERWFARFFAAHGFAAAVMARPIFEYDPSRGLEQLDEYLKASVAQNREILDFLALDARIDPQKIGAFGISFGAVVNSLWAGSDPRIRANVLALPGGNLPEIFVTSRDPLMQSHFKAALRHQQCDPAELKSRLEKILTMDPLAAAPSLSKDRTLLVLAIFDRVIRFSCGLAFRKALGEPETVFLPLGHYTAILSAPFLRWKMLRFFKEKLSALS